MYTIMQESNHQSMSDEGYSMLGLVHGDDPEGCYGEGSSCLGTQLHPWWIYVNVWQNQYSIVK